MTEPGGATTVGQIVGYLRLDTGDWRRGVEEARREAESLGRTSPNIRIQTNAADTSAKLAAVAAAERKVNDEATKAHKPLMSLYGALATIAPAAVPIASVAGGALAGMIPVTATLALGIKGISDEMKSGALEGTRYGRDLHQVGDEYDRLKTLAAGGLLSGIDRGLASSRPLFHVLNGDIAMMSSQIGDVAGGAAPALLRVLTELNPLFVTFGNLLTRGASELEHWTEHSTGVSSFVGYVEQELPTVMSFLGHLVVLLSHVAQAGAPFGGTLLTGLNLFVTALDHIPIPVLQALVPLLVATRVAMLGWRGTEAIIGAVNAALAKIGPSQEAAAARTAYANAQIRADEALTAAAVARAEAEKAAAAEEGAAQTYAALAGTGTALEDEALAAATAANEFSLAMGRQAAAATAAAETIAAEASAAADASVAAGETAGIGWTAALGPIAGLALGLGLLTSLFGRNDQAAQQNTEIMQGYADSLRQSTDGLAAVNTKQTIKNLQDTKSIDLLHQLHDANALAGVSQADLVLAVNGSSEAYDTLITKLKAYIVDGHAYTTANLSAKSSLKELNQVAAAGGLDKQGTAALNLAKHITQLKGSFTAAQRQQEQYVKAEREAQTVADGGAGAVSRQARALGLTRNAYLDAQQAARKNTEQTRQQTAAMQVEGDVAGLLQQALNGLAGRHLALATAATSLDSANLQVISSLKQSKGSLDSNTQAGLSAQQAIQGQANAAIQYAGVLGKQKHSSDAANQSLVESKQRLEDELRAQGLLTPAVQGYIDKLTSLKRFGDYLNHHSVKPKFETREALAQIRALNTALAQLHSHELSVGGYTNVKHSLSLPGAASGGGLPEGVSAVGEDGPELTFAPAGPVRIAPRSLC